MKNLLITFFTIIFCLTSSVGWGETINDLIMRDGLYYKKFTDVPFSGKVTGKKQGQLKIGIKEGLWNYYHDNGQLHEKGSYKKNIKDGNWVSYKETGELIYKGSYNQGIKEGYWIESRVWMDYSKFFMFKDYSFYKNGIKDGLYERKFRNGQLKYKGILKNGKQEGKWEEYTIQGKIFEISNYKLGLLNGPFLRYVYGRKFDDVKVTVGNFKDNKKEGKWIVYDTTPYTYETYRDIKNSGIFQQGKKIKDLPNKKNKD